jgi:hypothetical protein
MRDGSLETLAPFRDPRDELIRYRHKQAGAGLLFGLALAGIVVMARLENDPTSPWGRILTALAVIGATTGGTVLFSALMSHVEGSEKALRRDAPRPGALYSDKGSIAADEADAHPRLVALGGDISARRRRRLPVRVELRPGQMIISRAGVGRSDGGASETLGSGELVSAEVVPLIYGSGLAVRMRDGQPFAIALPVGASRLSRKLALWRNTPAPAFSFPEAEHYAGFLQPVTPAATPLPQTATASTASDASGSRATRPDASKARALVAAAGAAFDHTTRAGRPTAWHSRFPPLHSAATPRSDHDHCGGGHRRSGDTDPRARAVAVRPGRPLHR